ncbi:MAG: UxaA family hydrolase, partial [Halobacteriaceae archaeon]
MDGGDGAGDPPLGSRRDGRPPGVRDHVLVLPSVICSHVVAERIAERVPRARAAPHDHGCGQIGADKAQTRRTFLGVARNPNVAGAVVVGLGCEGVQSDGVAADLREHVPTRELSIQGEGGTGAAVEAGAA